MTKVKKHTCSLMMRKYLNYSSKLKIVHRNGCDNKKIYKEQPTFSIFDKSDSKDHKCILYVYRIFIQNELCFFSLK
jgi:hypothetical protein